MNAPKIISLLAFAGYAAVAIWGTAFVGEVDAAVVEFWLYASVNLGYYFFLLKRGKENRMPKYATSIALLLALIPLTGFPDLLIAPLLIKIFPY